MEERHVSTDTQEPGDKVSAETLSTVSVDNLEKMCRALYAYRFGTIGFLDMLAAWEKALGIEPPQINV